MKTLSDKIIYAEDYADKANIGRLLHFEDVKEFIRELKEDIKTYPFPIYNDIPLNEMIDNLAGDKLVDDALCESSEVKE